MMIKHVLIALYYYLDIILQQNISLDIKKTWPGQQKLKKQANQWTKSFWPRRFTICRTSWSYVPQKHMYHI